MHFVLLTSLNRLTRVLVLCGIVPLIHTLGLAQGKTPQEIVAEANNSFAFDLYREFSKTNEGNTFFSPYSISVALSMILEGARSETAAELGRCIHLPAVVSREGEDAQHRPFELSRIHRGHARMATLFADAITGPEQLNITEMIQEVQARVDALTHKIDSLNSVQKHIEATSFLAKLGPLNDQLHDLHGKRKTYRLAVANALWGEKTYPFNPAFVSVLSATYGAEAIVEADFRNHSERERKRINEWVETQTRGKIVDLLPRATVDSSTRLVLLNAIYFKANWLEPFDQANTRSMPFMGAGRTLVTAKVMFNWKAEQCRYAAFEADGSRFDTPEMMTSGQDQGLYPGAHGFLMLEMPYQGGDLSMIVLLPRHRDGLPALESQLTAKNLAKWLGALKQRAVSIALPKFEVESSFSLRGVLKSLGVRRAFRNPLRPDGAQFGGVTNSDDPRDQVGISAVIHKAFVSVEERGTEAAAATALLGPAPTGASGASPFVPEFHALQAFAYAVRDLRSGTILFMGRMVKP